VIKCNLERFWRIFLIYFEISMTDLDIDWLNVIKLDEDEDLVCQVVTGWVMNCNDNDWLDSLLRSVIMET
jgi:hypothetical protein